MLIRHPHLRRRARVAACAGAAFSVAMFTTTAWVSAESATPAAVDETEGLTVDLVSPDSGAVLTGGDAETPFTLDLPADAACTGDSVDDGYLVWSYLVAAEIDPATLKFNGDGVNPTTYEPQSEFRSTMYDLAGSQYVSVATAASVAPSGPGAIIDLPGFSLETLVDPDLYLLSGDYNLGIACRAPGADTPVDRYWNAAITVESGPAAGSEPPFANWTITVPDSVATETTLEVDPDGEAPEGDEVTLTATVTPAAAAGTVTFLRDGVAIGSPVNVATGTATLATTELAPGVFELTAEFTPTDSEAFAGSESTTVDYEIIAEADATATTTDLEADPADEASEGDTVTLTATVTPDDASGTVTFLDGTDPIGDPVTVTDGTATTTVDELAAGDHTLVAEFDPTDAVAFAASASDPLDYTITTDTPTPPIGGDPARVVSPDDPTEDLNTGDADTPFTFRLPTGAACPGDSISDQYQVYSYMVPVAVDPATLTFDFDGPVPGSLGEPYAEFRAPIWKTDQSPYLSVGTVAAEQPGGPGRIPELPDFEFVTIVEPENFVPSGTYNLGIACWGPGGEGATPTVDQFWNARMVITSEGGETPTLTWEAIQPVETTTVVTVAPGAKADEGDEVTLTATVTPAGAAGKVTFLRDGVAIGDPVDVAAGVAVLKTRTLAPGTFEISARFAPTDPDEHAPSEAAAVDYEIVADDPVATQITLAVTPSGGADVGDDVTLTATVTPAAAAGEVVFVDNGTDLDEDTAAMVAVLAATVSNGTATLERDDLPAGAHSFTARFVPTDPAAFAGSSTAAGVSFTIRAAQTTTTTSTSTTSTSSTSSTSTTLGGSTTSTTSGTTSTTVRSGTLPRTGSAPGALVLWAVLAIVLGTVAMALGRSPLVTRRADR